MTTPIDPRRTSVGGAHVLLFGGPDGSEPGQVLLVRRRNTGYRDGMLHASVAGHLDGGESVAAAAIREAEEELGITIAPGDLEFAHLCHSGENSAGTGGRMQVFFTCRRWSGRIRNVEPEKHSELLWLPAHRLPEDVVPYCAQAVRQHLGGRAFSVHDWPDTDAGLLAPRRPAAGSEDAGAAGSEWAAGSVGAANGAGPAGVLHAVDAVGVLAAQGVAGDAGVPGSLAAVLAAVAAERRAQEALFGVQDLPSGTSAGARPAVERARRALAIAADNGELTYRHLLDEEAAEAFAETDPVRLRAELIQVAAVATQWVQALDRAESGQGPGSSPGRRGGGAV